MELKKDYQSKIAANDWLENLDELENLGRKIDFSKSWLEILSFDTMELYTRKSERLRQFFTETALNPAGLKSPVIMAETPTFLRSVQGTASFEAALLDDDRELSFFKSRQLFQVRFALKNPVC